MFTLKHMNSVLGEIKGLSKTKRSVFSERKNALSYRLSKENSQHRGAIVEKMIRDLFIMQGKRVKYIGGNNSFDMMVDGQRVEVKSSLPMVIPTKRGNTLLYRFQNIKTNYFDQIILVYITPRGLVVKSFSQNQMTRMLIGSKYYSNGQTYSAKVA